MYRHGRAAVAAVAAAAAASSSSRRLRPAGPWFRAWAPLEGAGPCPATPRRRYRARPQDLQLSPRSRLPALPLLPSPTPRPPCRPLPLPSPRRCPSPPLLRALAPPEGHVTTVAGQREDDIVVRDPPRPAPLPHPRPAPLPLPHPPLLLWRPPPSPLLSPSGSRPSPTMEEHLEAMHQKLQHELPNFFLKVPDYGLYSPDVEFINHLLHMHTRGRPMYQVAVAACRALAWGYFASLKLEVLALTRHPEDWSLRARWRLTGLPLHLLLLRCYRRDKSQLLRSFDAFSTFFLDSQGLIRCHHVDKLMPAPRPLPEPKKLLVAAAVALALAQP